jgi:hypothetical protein
MMCWLAGCMLWHSTCVAEGQAEACADQLVAECWQDTTHLPGLFFRCLQHFQLHWKGTQGLKSIYSSNRNRPGSMMGESQRYLWHALSAAVAPSTAATAMWEPGACCISPPLTVKLVALSEV